MKNMLKEPLVHFFLIGAALFLIWESKSDPATAPGGLSSGSNPQVTVTQDDILRMNTLFTKTWQRPPTETEKKGLLEDFIRNEIFYREALAIGLDRDDEVLKRRLRQKMEFIYEEITALAEPTDAELRSMMVTDRKKYLLDPQIAFRQVYINATRRGADAASDAREILAELMEGADPHTLGDPTLLETELDLSPLEIIQRRFGSEFGQQLLDLAPGEWTGPIRSAYGLHLVFVNQHVDQRLPHLEQVRDILRRDWITRKQKTMKDAAYTKLRERYTITVERPFSSSGRLSAAADQRETTR